MTRAATAVIYTLLAREAVTTASRLLESPDVVEIQ